MLTPKHELQVLNSDRYTRVVGIDEAGRGCWAGPLAVGAFVFDLNSPVIEGVNDSKKVSAKKREAIFPKLSSPSSEVFLVSNDVIDEMGILSATEHLIHQAVEKYRDGNTLFLIDGRFNTDFGKNVQLVVRGDSIYYVIASASILAKVTRDRIMRDMDSVHTGYGFAKHKGYGTREHQEALAKLGVCKIHRKSYKPVKAHL